MTLGKADWSRAELFDWNRLAARQWLLMGQIAPVMIMEKKIFKVKSIMGSKKKKWREEDGKSNRKSEWYYLNEIFQKLSNLLNVCQLIDCPSFFFWMWMKKRIKLLFTSRNESFLIEYLLKAIERLFSAQLIQLIKRPLASVAIIVKCKCGVWQQPCQSNPAAIVVKIFLNNITKAFSIKYGTSLIKRVFKVLNIYRGYVALLKA